MEGGYCCAGLLLELGLLEAQICKDAVGAVAGVELCCRRSADQGVL